MASAIEVEGLDRMVRTLRTAARDVDRLTEPNRDIAGDQLASASPPVRTGQLAASGRTEADDDTGDVIYDAPYAAVIWFGSARRGITGRKWIHDDPAALAAIIRKHLEHTIRTVKGA